MARILRGDVLWDSILPSCIVDGDGRIDEDHDMLFLAFSKSCSR